MLQSIDLGLSPQIPLFDNDESCSLHESDHAEMARLASNLRHAARNGHLLGLWTTLHEINRKCDQHDAHAMCIDAADEEGETALTLASVSGHARAVQALLDKGANDRHQANFGALPIPLIRAAAAGHADCVAVLRHQAPDVSFCLLDACYEGGEFQGHNSLSIAALNGHLAVVRELLEEDPIADVHSGPYFGAPLLEACIRGHGQVVDFLLQHGADPDCHKVNGRQAAICSASERKCWPVCALLVAFGADVREMNDEEALLETTAFSILVELDEAVSALLDRCQELEVSLDFPIVQGCTLLTAAVASSNMPGLSMLLSHGASPGEKDAAGNTPLSIAAALGISDAVKVLLEHGANPNECAGEHSEYPLQIALQLWHASAQQAHLRHLCVDDNSQAALQVTDVADTVAAQEALTLIEEEYAESDIDDDVAQRGCSKADVLHALEEEAMEDERVYNEMEQLKYSIGNSGIGGLENNSLTILPQSLGELWDKSGSLTDEPADIDTESEFSASDTSPRQIQDVLNCSRPRSAMQISSIDCLPLQTPAAEIHVDGQHAGHLDAEFSRHSNAAVAAGSASDDGSPLARLYQSDVPGPTSDDAVADGSLLGSLASFSNMSNPSSLLGEGPFSVGMCRHTYTPQLQRPSAPDTERRCAGNRYSLDTIHSVGSQQTASTGQSTYPVSSRSPQSFDQQIMAPYNPLSSAVGAPPRSNAGSAFSLRSWPEAEPDSKAAPGVWTGPNSTDSSLSSRRMRRCSPPTGTASWRDLLMFRPCRPAMVPHDDNIQPISPPNPSPEQQVCLQWPRVLKMSRSPEDAGSPVPAENTTPAKQSAPLTANSPSTSGSTSCCQTQGGTWAFLAQCWVTQRSCFTSAARSGVPEPQSALKESPPPLTRKEYSQATDMLRSASTHPSCCSRSDTNASNTRIASCHSIRTIDNATFLAEDSAAGHSSSMSQKLPEASRGRNPCEGPGTGETERQHQEQCGGGTRPAVPAGDAEPEPVDQLESCSFADGSGGFVFMAGISPFVDLDENGRDVLHNSIELASKNSDVATESSNDSSMYLKPPLPHMVNGHSDVLVDRSADGSVTLRCPMFCVANLPDVSPGSKAAESQEMPKSPRLSENGADPTASNSGGGGEDWHSVDSSPSVHGIVFDSVPADSPMKGASGDLEAPHALLQNRTESALAPEPQTAEVSRSKRGVKFRMDGDMGLMNCVRILFNASANARFLIGEDMCRTLIEHRVLTAQDLMSADARV